MNPSQNQEENRQKVQQIKIRQMVVDDLAPVFHLGEKLFQPDSMPNLYRTWDEFEVIGLYNSDTEYCLVAEYQQELVGFALGTTISKAHSAWKYGYLTWLGVSRKYQRLGVAEKLFQRFRTLMLQQGVRMLIADTQAENLSALRFFRKVGFGNPCEHIYLSLNLASSQQQLRRKTDPQKPDPLKIDLPKTEPQKINPLKIKGPDNGTQAISD